MVTFALIVYVCLAGPAASCAGGSTDPCCNWSSLGFAYDLPQLELTAATAEANTDFAYCGTDNAQDTATITQTQTYMNGFGSYFVTNLCFGGTIASSPGSTVEPMPFSKWQSLSTTLNCPIAFKYNGSYTAWSSPSSCEPLQADLCSSTTVSVTGQQMETRNCTNPPPYNGGANCSSMGAAVQTFTCQYACPTAAPVTVTPTTQAPTTTAPPTALPGSTPASSCAGGATNPCCNMAAASLDIVYNNLLTAYDTAIFNGEPTFAYCGTDNAADTADQAGTKEDVDNVGTFFNANNCYGGQVASSPGSAVSSLSTNGFMCLVKTMNCGQPTFPVTTCVSYASRVNVSMIFITLLAFASALFQ